MWVNIFNIDNWRNYFKTCSCIKMERNEETSLSLSFGKMMVEEISQIKNTKSNVNFCSEWAMLMQPRIKLKIYIFWTLSQKPKPTHLSLGLNHDIHTHIRSLIPKEQGYKRIRYIIYHICFYFQISDTSIARSEKFISISITIGYEIHTEY